MEDKQKFGLEGIWIANIESEIRENLGKYKKKEKSYWQRKNNGKYFK